MDTATFCVVGGFSSLKTKYSSSFVREGQFITNEKCST